MKRDERGAAAVEYVIILPALLLVIGVLVAGGRLAHTRAVVTGAAESAARAASLAREPALALADARAVATSELAVLGCQGNPGVKVDTSGFAVAVGRPASVSVEVSCLVPLSGLVPGVSGPRLVEAKSESVLDRYRGRY